MPIYLDEYGYERYLKRFEEMEPVAGAGYAIESLEKIGCCWQ